MWWVREQKKSPLGLKPCWGECDCHLGTVATADNGVGYEHNLVSLPSITIAFLPVFFYRILSTSWWLLVKHLALKGNDIKTNNKEFLSEANGWPNDKQTSDKATLSFSTRPFCKLIGFGTAWNKELGEAKMQTHSFWVFCLLNKKLVTIMWYNKRRKDGWQSVVKARAYEGPESQAHPDAPAVVQGWTPWPWYSWGLLWGLGPLRLSQRMVAFALRPKWLSEMLVMNLCLSAAPSMVPRAGARSKEAIWFLFMEKAPSYFCRSTSSRTGNGGLDSQGTWLGMELQKVGAVIIMFYGELVAVILTIASYPELHGTN